MAIMGWTQVYTPVGNSLVLSALLAALPVVVLLGLLPAATAVPDLAGPCLRVNDADVTS